MLTLQFDVKHIDANIPVEFCKQSTIAKLAQGIRALGSLDRIKIQGKFFQLLSEVMATPHRELKATEGRLDRRKLRRREQEMKYLKTVRRSSNAFV
jgi:hypothetical protein